MTSRKDFTQDKGNTYRFIYHKFLIETDIMIYYQNSNKQLRVWLTNLKNVCFVTY